jgi:hypothetical protein
MIERIDFQAGGLGHWLAIAFDHKGNEVTRVWGETFDQAVDAVKVAINETPHRWSEVTPEESENPPYGA